MNPLSLAKVVPGSLHPEGDWKLAGGASHRITARVNIRPGRGGGGVAIPTPLRGWFAGVWRSGGLRHRLISAGPPGLEPLSRDSRRALNAAKPILSFLGLLFTTGPAHAAPS